MKEPTSIAELRTQLMKLLKDGAFDAFEDLGVDLVTVEDSIDEFISLCERADRFPRAIVPTPAQKIMGQLFITLVEQRIEEDVQYVA